MSFEVISFQEVATAIVSEEEWEQGKVAEDYHVIVPPGNNHIWLSIFRNEGLAAVIEYAKVSPGELTVAYREHDFCIAGLTFKAGEWQITKFESRYENHGERPVFVLRNHPGKGAEQGFVMLYPVT